MLIETVHEYKDTRSADDRQQIMCTTKMENVCIHTDLKANCNDYIAMARVWKQLMYKSNV